MLHEAQSTYLPLAVRAQGSYFVSGILVGILPPLAVFLLCLQILVFSDGGPWALGLIFAEITCLALLTYFAWTHLLPTYEWVGNRIRSELLRREQYLCLARVGPYSGKSETELESEAVQRKGMIEAAEASTLPLLIPLQDSSGKTWLELLWQRTSKKLPDLTDLQARINCYLYNRIGKQLLWFANEHRDLGEQEELWTMLQKAVLLGAVVGAALHAFHLHEAAGSGAGEGRTAVWTGLVSIILPPIAAALISMQTLYNFRSRRKLYQKEKGLLHMHYGILDAISRKVGAVDPQVATYALNDLESEFQAAVLRTEQSLSFEMEQWALLMERYEHDVSA